MTQAEEVFKGLIKEIAEDLNYKNYTVTTKPITSGGANYSSYLFIATLSAPGKDDVNLFAKVASIGRTLRDSVPKNLYVKEQYFYKYTLKKYREIEDKYNVASENRFATAKFYAASTEYLLETLVLENLTVRGFESFNRFQSIDWAYASYSIKQLALFHALSIAYSKEDPAGFKIIEKPTLPGDLMTNTIEKAFSKAISLVKEENKDRLTRFLENSAIRKPVHKLYGSSELPIIIHGDYRPSNMMHKVHSDGTVEVITLDYQTLQRGCPVADLLYFLILGSDKKYREQYWQNSFDLYYQELSAALRRFEMDPNEIYNKKAYQNDVQDLLPYTLSYGLFLLLVVTVDENDAPTVDEDFQFDGLNVRASELYVKRMNELVEDCIALGVL